jgi:hypothetical protein
MPPYKVAKVRRIRKLWGAGLASLPGLDGKRRRQQDEVDFIDVGHNTQFDTTDDQLTTLSRALASESLAKRIRTLQRERHPYGTVPEMITLDYLEKNNREHVYQAALYGGNRPGGLIVDFLVEMPGGWRGLAIQGIYWHNIPGKREKDTADKLRTIGTKYMGQVIFDVVFVWENQIVCPDPKRTAVLDDSLVGIEHVA